MIANAVNGIQNNIVSGSTGIQDGFDSVVGAASDVAS